MDMRSLNGLISRDKERAREPDSLPTLMHISSHAYTYVCTELKSTEDEASAAGKFGVYTRALDGHKYSGLKQHIHARVHLAFHSI